MKRMIRNRKKLNGKRIAAAAVAGLSAAAVVMTAVLSDVMEAEAADTLLGIEKLRTRYKESGSEFVILEVVPDRAAAEIGYLVSGYEPILCEWDEEEMVWSNWKNTLCELPKTRRKDFVEGKKEELREYYKKQGIEKNFPVEAVEDEYEEGEPRQEGFEKIVSDGAPRTGWFQKISGTPEEGTDRYQVAFNFNGLYNGNYEFYEDTLYYTVTNATEITPALANGIENDRPIYTKEGEGVYSYCGTWEEINNVVIASFDEDLPEEEDKENEEKPKPDDGKNDDDDKNNGGSGDDNSGDNGNGGNGDDSGSGDENEDNNGDDSGNEDNNSGDDSGSEDNRGDDSGSEDKNDGGDDSGSEDKNDDGDDSSSGDNNSGSNGGSDSSDHSEDTGNDISSADVAKRTTSVFASLREGKWFKLVADDTPVDGSGDGTNAGGVSESQDDTTADDQLNPGEGEGSHGDADVDNPGQDDNADKNQSDTDDNTEADNTNPDEADSDNADIDDNADSDEDEPAADDPVDDDESEKNTLAQEDGSKEYYLVAFQRDSADAVPADGTPMYSVDTRNIVLSEDGEYIFIEWDGEDASQPRQEYQFDGKEIWCKNTFKSNEWFKKYVLNMDKVDYGDFRIKVLTFTPQELNDMEQIPNFDFLYLNSGLRVDGLEDGGDVSGNSIDTGDDGSTENDDGTEDENEVSAFSGSAIKSRLMAADSIQGTWRKLVANDNVEESIDSLGKDGTLENDSDSGNGGDSDTDSNSGNDGADTDNGSGNGGGSDTSSGSEGSGGSDIGSDSENAGDSDTDAGSDTDSGSENSGDSETDGDSGSDAGSGSDDKIDSDTDSGSQDGDDSDEGSISENSTGSDKKTVKATSDGVSDDNSDKTVHNYSADNDLSDPVLKYFFDKTIAGAMPCLVDGSILYVKDDSGSIAVNEELQNTNIFRLSAMLCQDDLSEWYEQHRNNYARLTVKQLMDGIVEDADKNFVEGQVYCRFGNGSDSIINDQFYAATIYQDGGEIEPGFQCVLDEIKLENLYRESDTSGNYKPLSTSISQAKAVRHILNYRDRRKVETKKEIKVLEIQPAMADEAELTLDQIKAWAPGVEKAEITVMTTAEFIGKIEKLNETYDLIYIGTSKDHLNMRYWTDSSYYGKPDEKHVAAGTAFNDVDMDGLIYYNIGDLRVVNLPMLGLLTSEYKNNNRSEWTYFYSYVRYGGNDISKEKMNALVSFLDGSYPVIIADDFMEQPVTVYADKEYKGARVNLTEGEYDRKQLTALGVKNLDISSFKVKDGYRITVFDGDNFTGNSVSFTKDVDELAKQVKAGGNWDNKTVSLIVEREENTVPAREIDGDHIDNCTYLYEFVAKAMKDKYLNFYVKGDIEENSELFKFYLNRPKASLTEIAVNGEVEEGSDLYYINPDRNGKYTLQYRFKIQNEGAASYNTRYICKLYIDVNSDGKFSGQEEIEDITITQNGGYVSQDALYADRTYMLTRTVPAGYKGLLPWKVEITQADNKNIYTSMSGYTKLNGMEKEVLKICQINKNGADVIDLNYEVNTKGRHFNTLVYGGDYNGEHYAGIADEFELDITTISVADFQREYYANNEYLKDFNMLILGFSDMYGDFEGDSESGPMGAIVDFINSGKSVLLGHDTTSYFNCPNQAPWEGDQAMYGYPWRNNYELHNIWWYNESRGWYYTRNAATLNKYVRPLVGMDRYGILDSEILQRGSVLTEGSGDYNTVVNSGKDVAYKPKSGRTETVPEVHGYTYALISAKDQKVLQDNGTTSTYQYTKWNLMSDNYQRYPEVVFENKYTNIRFDPAWFWENYDGKENDPQGNDIPRYGEMEKVNNGEVWNVHATQVNKGQITEYPYKLQEEFEVALTHTQYYELDYTADDDGDGESDLVVWYCLGGRTSTTGHSDWETTIYSQSPNDVRNNYYIYNKGNITYTGMGHARCKWEGAEWYTFEEAKLFINTMIASYQAGIKDPQISVLKSGVPEADTMKLLYRYYDKSNNFSLNDEMTAEDYEKIYFTVEDINFIKGTRKIESHVYYQDDGGGEVINVDGTDITVNRLPDSIYSAKDGSAVDATNLTSAGIYYIQVPKQIMKKCEDGLDLYFEAQSTITTNTTKANVYKTEKVYAKLQVLQAYLFDLE
ncbi:MAG: DUF5057 domain-containing protein [Lachnospiraceae bacterium]|nr:DUF5057 domain-containing protein [Lachnospiraceae bacterium]